MVCVVLNGRLVGSGRSLVMRMVADGEEAES